ncbi:unnamed protein product [Amoebophrya sp. A25]|nr:unnamed protein product [Amoebophrya sp. A25]|eukprot:GSA25T00024932001.1
MPDEEEEAAAAATAEGTKEKKKRSGSAEGEKKKKKSSKEKGEEEQAEGEKKKKKSSKDKTADVAEDASPEDGGKEEEAEAAAAPAEGAGDEVGEGGDAPPRDTETADKKEEEAAPEGGENEEGEGGENAPVAEADDAPAAEGEAAAEAGEGVVDAGEEQPCCDVQPESAEPKQENEEQPRIGVEDEAAPEAAGDQEQEAGEPTVVALDEVPEGEINVSMPGPTDKIIRTLQDAIQALTEGTHLVEDDFQRQELLTKQQQLRQHCIDLQLLSGGSRSQPMAEQPVGLGETAGVTATNVIRPEDYGNEDLRQLVEGLERMGSQSPLLRSLAEPGSLTSLDADPASIGQQGYIGMAGEEQRPPSVASSEFERELDHVRGIRRKMDLAKNGKNVVDYAPEDAAWYEIDDAERDVVDLRRMRRQIRCLFGTQGTTASSIDPAPQLSNLKGPRFPDSPSSSVNDAEAILKAQSLFEEYGRSPTAGVYPAVHTRVKGGGSSGPQKNIDSILKNAGHNWAEEVVKAAVQPGNQWNFAQGRQEARAVAKRSYVADLGPSEPSTAWLGAAVQEFKRAYGDKSASKVMNLGGNRQYIGDLAYGKPDGHGVLVLADGSQHVGTFKGGRANGKGVFLSTRGSVLYGEWAENRRVGTFNILDRYELGERVSREKGEAVGIASSLCIRCQSRYYPDFNHLFGCRTLRKGTTEAANSEDPEWVYTTHTTFVS